MTFDSAPTIMVAALLVGAAAMIWMAGAPLARSTDALSLRFGLGQALGGLLLLAIATNLPEIAIVVSAAAKGDLSIAIGNILGGIAAQTAILIVIDRVAVRGGPPLATRASTPALQIEALLVMAIMAATALGAYGADGFVLGSLGAGDLLVPAVWLLGIAVIARMRPSGAPTDPAVRPASGGAVATFALASLATLAGGVILEATGSALAVRFGVDGALFGATVLAAATSLPELTTGLAAVRQGEDELAASDILGGNAFLPVLLTFASLLAGQSAYAAIGSGPLALCATGLLMTAAFAAALAARPQRRLLGTGPEAMPMLAAYALGLALIAGMPS